MTTKFAHNTWLVVKDGTYLSPRGFVALPDIIGADERDWPFCFGDREDAESLAGKHKAAIVASEDVGPVE